MKTERRVFEDKPAVRESVPLLIGLDGPSGGGKTFSALRLATGIQKVSGGDIWYIDTEARRALHYADRFRFRHLPFGAPFSPLDYLAAIEHCASKGAKTVVVDSMSHEHEGPGGVLEMHAEIVERKSGGDPGKAERVKLGAWAEPKAQRRRMINTILQMPINFIFCFRAKEKLKVIPGREPEQMGFMPIAGEEFVYEMTVCCLLPPGSGGVPQWRSKFQGEQMMMKLPIQFEGIFAESKPLDEGIGEAMARWAAGAADEKGHAARIRRAIAAAASEEDLKPILAELNDAPKTKIVTGAEQRSLKEALRTRAVELKHTDRPSSPESTPPPVTPPDENDRADVE